MVGVCALVLSLLTLPSGPGVAHGALLPKLVGIHRSSREGMFALGVRREG